MNNILVKIDQLKVSPSNVRSKHTVEDIAMMAHSIKQRGIINPLTVVKNGDGRYEVIAGLLRYKGAIEAKLEAVPCHDATGLTEAERIDISLSENKDRREMSSIQLYAAFHKLFKAGESVEKIGERFNKNQRDVQKILAIGSLHPKLLELAEKEKIGDRTIRTLAIATPEDQARYLKLSPKERPADWKIHEWLAGKDGMYLAANAIFDINEYTGPQIVDLFTKDDEVWLSDGKQFWDLQNAEIKATVEGLEKTGWKVTKLEYFQNYQYNKTSKKDGGQVYYTVDDRSGTVVFHKGYAPLKSAGKTPKAKNEKKQEKPETSQAFDAFMAETRHAAVQQRMLDDVGSGLIATVVLLLKQCDNIRFGNQSNLVKSDAYLKSLEPAKKTIRDEFDVMIKELGISKDYQLYGVETDKLAKKVAEYSSETLTDWIITIVAYRWSMQGGPTDSDAIGKAIGLVQVDEWQADDAFWNGITNKATLISIGKELGQSFDEKAKTSKMREILKKNVTKDWRPSWLKF